ncbi:MAG: sterol desaturase family protein [Bacteroidia bacterium]
MEAYAQVLSYAIPGFILLIIIEAIAAKRMGMKVNYGMDTISSLSSGMTNTLKNLTGLSIVIISYEWMESHLAIFEIKSTIWLYVLAFIGIDFAGYWSHRFDHVVNLFWNRHIVHHSSEEFNLACALRQSISAVVGIYFFLYIPMAIIGIPPKVVAITAPLHLFAQFWYHTRLVGRMGFLEYIIVTPSHHRVHHAINPEYIDKNFSQIFIFWDKWFGTFQEELPDVQPVYGTKVPAHTWNPVLINFMHAWSLAKDAWHTRNWWDKIRLWFMPTGWRPEDVKEKYPVNMVKDIYNRPKYHTGGSVLFQGWVWFQLIVNNLLLYHMMVQIGDYTFPEILLYALVLMVSIFAYTSLMDMHPIAFPAELVKLGMGVWVIFSTGGWFKLDEIIPGGTMIVAAYLIVSAAMAGYFHFAIRSARL